MTPTLDDRELEARLRVAVPAALTALEEPGDVISAPATLARHQRADRPRWWLIGSAAAALVALLVAVAALTARPAARGALSRGAPTVASAPPLTTVAPLPEYRWSEVPPPDFDLAGYRPLGVNQAGEVVLWNGTQATEDAPTRDVRLAFVRVETGAWRRSSEFPLGQRFSDDAQLLPSGDVLVVQNDNSSAADELTYYSAAGDAWTIAPRLGLHEYVVGSAVAGRTVAVVTAHNNLATSSSVEPVAVRRWTIGDSSWVDGATSPLSPRSGPTGTGAAGRIAVYGGLTDARDPDSIDPHSVTVTTLTDPAATDPAATDPARRTPQSTIGLPAGFSRVLLNGAIYDVAGDRWTPTGNGPAVLDGRIALSADGQLVVPVGATPTPDQPGWQALQRWSPNAGWQAIDAGGEHLDLPSSFRDETVLGMTADRRVIVVPVGSGVPVAGPRWEWAAWQAVVGRGAVVAAESEGQHRLGLIIGSRSTVLPRPPFALDWSAAQNGRLVGDRLFVLPEAEKRAWLATPVGPG